MYPSQKQFQIAGLMSKKQTQLCFNLNATLMTIGLLACFSKGDSCNLPEPIQTCPLHLSIIPKHEK